MTLEEAIRHCEEVAKSCQLKAYDIERGDYKDLEECSAEHRQLAEWLKELKEQRGRTTTNERTETHACDYGKKETHGDVIYRQAAISLFDRDHAGKYWWRINNDILHEIRRDLKSLPSAEPEIIRCEDCKHWDTTWTNDYAPDYHYCPMIDMYLRKDFFCADAEKIEKTEE